MADDAGLDAAGPDERLLAEADALYALAPGDFTPARDARARELKREAPELAAAVKGLRRPSVAAWLVDQLVRHDPDRVDELLQVGAALREAQDALSADDLRAFTKQRRQLTASVTTRARALGRQLGTKVSESVAEQVEATLTAAVLDAGAGEAVRTGLLVTALRPAGVDPVDVDAALAVPGAAGHVAVPVDGSGDTEETAGPALRVVPDDPGADDRRRQEAEDALAAAEEALGVAEAELEEVEEEVEDLEARSLQAEARVEELRTRLAEAETRQARVEDQLADAEESRDEQREAVEAARAERDEVRQRLSRWT
ncbi:regulator of replication initiation timing [Nocardioides zeae]|uniref:Regulator of replication initiation timing n=1 Tax=Nocardioides zeae TaxID=1457234 RepID=A0ACC6IG39_9ACTN|nr:hypothetical protein [Nocardioides zeae]MDR6176684.1 regulator of replication initiation timing [Nocardioides zeae]MDR6209696.1 regulator of replication initiation timing [Nocardioides zeae]